MKRKVFACIILFFTSLVIGQNEIKIHYTVDLTRIESDSFYVMLNVEGIKTDSIVFQFASTAPGAYEVMNVGRFVGNFEAFDYSDELLKIYRKDVNQYVIYNAKSLGKIQYQVEDSYDTNIKEFPIFSAAGSNLEKDNVVINGQMVFGYFQGYQENPVTVNFNYPKDWLVGTALPTEDGKYFAEDYDRLVDSPLMIGELTKSTLEISDTKVDVYCYSQNKVITASIIADTLEPIVKAVEKFLGALPVKHYAFLFHFRKDVQGGALEHNYSSYYAMPEDDITQLLESLLPTASHEFCHIVTPLHIHSDIIEQFNFEKPVASRHLWFYEGVTNWMESTSRLRGGLISEADFFDEIISSSLRTSTRLFDSTVSLIESSLGCYNEYEFEWYHAYSRGGLVGLLLDLKILELSDYKVGLKDVIIKLLNEYKTKSFPDEKFFNIIVEHSYPEIREILERYVGGTDALPMKEYLDKIGYDYIPEVKTGKQEA
ncbi:MAG: peptidase, partial [Ignavibacteriales bacterium]